MKHNIKYKNLEAELARKGMSKKELHHEIESNFSIKLSYETLTRYLTGKSDPPLGVSGAISKILNCSIDYLFREGD